MPVRNRPSARSVYSRATMYAALTWLLAQAAARRGDDVVGDARRRAALRRAPQIPTAAPLPFRAPGVLPVDAEPHTAAAAVGDLKQRLSALQEAAPAIKCVARQLRDQPPG